MKFQRKKKKIIKGIECLNCGMPMHGTENFCPNCGQKNEIRKLKISNFLVDFFDNFFSFDSRLFKTIKVLILKPGMLAKEYIAGKRTTYVNPFKLLLHTSIVYFLLSGLFSLFISTNNKNTTEIKIIDDDLTNQKENRKVLDSVFEHDKLLTLFTDNNISDNKKDSIYTKAFLSIYTNADYFLKEKQFTTIDKLNSGKTIALLYYLDKYLKDKNIQYPNSYLKNARNNVNNKLLFFRFIDYTRIIKSNIFNDKTKSEKCLKTLGLHTDKGDIIAYNGAKKLKMVLKNEHNDMKIFYDSIISKITISLFFILPIFGLFFSLFYIRHPSTYTSNLVLIFNIQTAFFILLIFVSFINSFFSFIGFLTNLLFIGFVFYIYKSLRNFYQQNRFKTIIKSILVIFTYFILATIGFISISFISLFL